MKILLLALVAWVVVAGQGIAAQNGSAAKEAELRKLIAQTIAEGKHLLQIPPGTYRLGPEPSKKAHLLLDNVHDLRIEAAGVELEMSDGLNTPLVALYNCTNVTIVGLTVDCDPVVFLQGTVAGIAPAREWYDIRVDPGYTLDPTAIAQRMRPLSILDRGRAELPWKHGVPDLYHSKIAWVDRAGRVLRVYTAAHCRGRYPVERGDLAVLPAFGAAGFTCRGSRDIGFDHCTIYQSGSMAFHEHGGEGNTHLVGCRVLRRPGSGRLLSTNADGFHSKNMRHGATVGDCIFEGMHDDGINIHGMFARVAEAGGDATLQVVPYFEEPGRPGDTVEFFSGKTGQSLGCRTVRQIQQLGHADAGRAATYHGGEGHGLLFRYALDQPISLHRFDALMNLDCCGAGFTIRNNEFRASRYRGILIRSINGAIEDNRIYSLGMDGIVLESDLFSEGPYACDIAIRGNTIRRVGLIPYSHSGRGIAVFQNVDSKTMRPGELRLNRHIRIENNQISDVTRDGIYVRNSAEVVLKNNTVSEIAVRPVVNRTPPQAVSVE